MTYLILFVLATLGIQMGTPQMLPPPFHLLRPETMIDPGAYLPTSPTVISEPPINSLVSLPNMITEPSTTIITDCSPTICKNLANTIQLMIVCNLLGNSKGSSDFAMQLAAPIINEVLSSPTFSCGCTNPLSPTVTTNLISPNVITPNLISPSVVSSNIAGPNGVQLTPRVISSPGGCPNSVVPNYSGISPNVPLAGQLANTNGLISTLMNLLGNVQGL